MTTMNRTNRWEQAGRPTPTSAIRLDGPDREMCAFDCGRRVDFLIKIENEDSDTAKTRVCKPCNDEYRIWADRHLPPNNTEDPNQ